MHGFAILLLSLLPLSLAVSCGSGENINKLLFVRKADQKRFDSLILEARILHDNGEYEASIEVAEKAGKMGKYSEELIQLKAFNELALAGFSIFEIIGKIIEQSATQDSSSNATDLLGGLSAILEINSDDLDSLGTKSDLPNNELLKGLSVYIPNDPGSIADAESPRAKVATLKHLNQAIETICPLISAELRDAANETAGRYVCADFNGIQTQSAQSYFVFFVAHLAETLVFNLVLLYSPENAEDSVGLTDNPLELLAAKEIQDTSNIFKRINAVQEATSKGFNLSNLASISEATSEVASNVKAIFETEKGSMLYELMNNFKKAVGSFQYIEGMPDSVTEQLTSSLKTIEDAAEKAQGVSSKISGQTSTLKDKMSNKIISKLNNQVDKVLAKITEYEAQEATLTTEQKAQVAEAKAKTKVMCTSLDSILSGLPDISKPDGCSAL